MLLVGVVGLGVNVLAAWLMIRSGGDSLNVRAATRHVLADLLGSAGVILAALIVLTTGWVEADPAVSVLIGILVLASSWSVLRESVGILLESTPPGIDAEEVGRAMVSLHGVREVHDLHIWTITSGFPALSAHVLVDQRRGLPRAPRRARAAPPRPLRARPHDAAGGARDRRPAGDHAVRLEGKTAIVTGASSGIGAAIVRGLRAEGVRVAGGARRADRIDADVALELDVTDPASCEAFVAQAVDGLGGLDLLVNGAGLALGRDPFWESSEEDERIVLETNVNGLIRMTRLCLPHIRDGGHIVNIGSIAGRQAYPNGSLYVTSKYAVRGFTYALREDLLGRPIRLTTVDPGLVETDFSRVRFRGDEEAAKAVYAGVEAMTPDDVAECVVFAVTRPPHVNVDEIVVKALAQSSGARILRSEP